MSRYIDADALREKWLCLQGHDFSPSSFVYSIDNAPTVDAVQVVRCGECEYHGDPHRTDMGVDVVWCNFYNTHKLKDGYCNCGERKDGAV